MNRKLQKLMLRWINIWPPLLGAGIRVRWRSNRAVDVEMKLRSWNRNYVGTHYGGSLYSMTDPFYMLMLMENLGRDYIVLGQGGQHPVSQARQGKGQGRVSVKRCATRRHSPQAHDAREV